MGLVIIGIVAISLFQYFLAKKSKCGSILPILSLIYLVYDYATKSQEPNFKITDIVVSISIFVILLIIWLFMFIGKRNSQ